MAAERGHDDAQRLRQHDEAEGLQAMQAERQRALDLAVADILDAGAHDLDGVGRAVEHQRDQRALIRVEAKPDASAGRRRS